MFEYLMPLLVMPTYENTLLDLPFTPPSSARSSMAASGRAVGHV